MTDRGRSPEEIEAAIEDRQEDLAEDMEDLEYHLSRRGMKDRARNEAKKTVSTAKERVVERTGELREEAAGRVRSASSGAKQQMDKWSQNVSRTVKNNRWKLGLVGAGLAIGVGAAVAQMTKPRSSSRPTRGEHERQGSPGHPGR